MAIVLGLILVDMSAFAQHEATGDPDRSVVPAPVLSMSHVAPDDGDTAALELAARIRRIGMLLDTYGAGDNAPEDVPAPPISTGATAAAEPPRAALSDGATSKRMTIREPVEVSPGHSQPALSPAIPAGSQAGSGLRTGLILSWRMSCGGLAELWLHDDGRFCFHQQHGRRLYRQSLSYSGGPLPGWRRMVTLDDGTEVWQDPTGRQLQLVRSFVLR
jgi:hypothetical protein